MSSRQLKKVKHQHEALMDFMIENPQASAAAAGVHLGMSATWISIVKNSDSFKEAWAERRKEHASLLSATVLQKTEAVADMALDLMGQRLEELGEQISMKELRETADMALKKLGYGGESGAVSGQVNVNVGVVTREILESAQKVIVSQAGGERERRRALPDQSGVVEDADAA